MKKINRIVIVGCSRFGSSIASLLSSKNKEVVIIDANEKNFEKLATNYSGFKQVGDGSQVDVLIQAGIEKADMVVAATDRDHVNMMVAEIAKQCFNVERVVCRLYDPEKETIYNDFNISIVNPTQLTLKAFELLLSEMPL